MHVCLVAALWLSAALVHAETYCFGFLNAHPERKPIADAEAQEIQKGHMAHMEKMADRGHLLAAGPMATPGGPRGILIYRCTSLDQAAEWTAGDPAVQSKRLTLDVHLWTGPDGIGEPGGAMRKADPSTKPTMIQLPFFILRRTERWGSSGPPSDAMAEHSRQAKKLLADGTLRAGGPFTDQSKDLMELMVFAEMPLNQAKAMVEQDALVRGGYVRFEPHMWFVADETIPKQAKSPRSR